MSARPTDLMIKCMGSFIEDKDYVYHGLDSILPQLAMVYASLYLKKDFIFHSVAEPFLVDASQVLIRPSTGDPHSESSGIATVTTIDAFDLAAKGKMDLMYFGTAQIDEYANINLTSIGSYDNPKVKLPGGAATAYLYPIVKKIVIWARHDPRVLVKKVDFITGNGKMRIDNNLKTVLCTNRALIEFTKNGPILRAVFQGYDVEQVLNTGGMKISVPDKVDIIKELNEEELNVINKADPNGLRYEENYG
ncbi:acyl CoA:acetate/3-ketoacid CoA transferase, beta subunit [Caldisphaera lagunensis DSM 15908]|uniref:Acyl CoA:acetate/3-ketoacid CoA transferase, beta subunit n=1 Tax=Caldisphaera lagunensis (strain DSM 15908 / JCM 11604 / ANMR 0165 / IC-154) TaxID=1056495 RepID=L0A7K4_CALLD|nr:acyl CoA--acetate/3-ketoacid CoA transferase subunit beta [Caldisphaera lagunensis]AFZ69853.1 acyl CoA:acetate/3-ketoacid CoA transferase, beta subunit [Caldisphaera lagunensis DSM 15908]